MDLRRFTAAVPLCTHIVIAGAICLLGGAPHFSKLNFLGCPGRQFTPDPPRARVRPACWRFVALPCLVLLLFASILPLLGVMGAVWLALVCASSMCLVAAAFVLKVQQDRHRLGQLVGTACCYPLMILVGCAVMMEVWAVPMLECIQLSTCACCCGTRKRPHGV